MSRYIDADKLLERMLDLFSPTEQTNVAMSIPDWLVREEVGDLIKNTPTADVVPREKYDRIMKCAIELSKAVSEYERKYE